MSSTVSDVKKNLRNNENSNRQTNTKIITNTGNKKRLRRDPKAYFELEEIVGKKRRKNRIEYQVKWVGCPSSENTWEPFWNLGKDCEHLIKAFELKAKKERAEARARARSAPPHVKSPKNVLSSRNSPESSSSSSLSLSTEKADASSNQLENSLESSPSSFSSRNNDRLDQDVYDSRRKSEERIVEKNIGRRRRSQSLSPVSSPYNNHQDLVQACEDKLEKSARMEVDSEEEIDSDLPKEIEKIIGRNDDNGDIKFVVKFKNNEKEFVVRNKVARILFPHELIRFYDTNLKWLDGESNDAAPLIL